MEGGARAATLAVRSSGDPPRSASVAGRPPLTAVIGRPKRGPQSLPVGEVSGKRAVKGVVEAAFTSRSTTRKVGSAEAQGRTTPCRAVASEERVHPHHTGCSRQLRPITAAAPVRCIQNRKVAMFIRSADGTVRARRGGNEKGGRVLA